MKTRHKNGRYVPDKTATYGLSMKKSLHSRDLLRVYTSVAFLARNLPLALWVCSQRARKVRKKSADMSALNAALCRSGIILWLAVVLLLASRSTHSGEFLQKYLGVLVAPFLSSDFNALDTLEPPYKTPSNLSACLPSSLPTGRALPHNAHLWHRSCRGPRCFPMDLAHHIRSSTTLGSPSSYRAPRLKRGLQLSSLVS
ncbi:hypothetical protein ALC57_09519 [Trachymyrmex cornetzi]|uniref:Uncharacterized protein n=1 Tax=Trachymyrmex cornetzi TaxID=471704 RepID=A0A195DZY5_9HYME|nr:hypothetical protein ALC57_09519 [Trachymyrmex cornetzi]